MFALIIFALSCINYKKLRKSFLTLVSEASLPSLVLSAGASHCQTEAFFAPAEMLDSYWDIYT